VKKVISRPLLSGFLLGLFFDPENRSDMFLRNVGDFKWTTRRYIPEDRPLSNHGCEDLKSYKLRKCLQKGVTEQQFLM
jgi:hypothetical protein